MNSPNPFILLSDLHDNGMMILDPFTSLNVAKSSFKVDEIKSAFMKALNIINKGIYCNMDNVESSNILNELFNFSSNDKNTGRLDYIMEYCTNRYLEMQLDPDKNTAEYYFERMLRRTGYKLH